jgi:hypothetical protein
MSAQRIRTDSARNRLLALGSANGLTLTCQWAAGLRIAFAGDPGPIPMSET